MRKRYLPNNIRVRHTAELDRLRTTRNNILQRCTNPNAPTYKYYGGRGIGICEEWLYSFDTFADWALSHGYRNDLSIDRIDNNGDYCPKNCRWVTMNEQVHNQRPKKGGWYFDGEYRSKTDIARMLGMPLSTLHSKMKTGKTLEFIAEQVGYAHE